jgi:hypothetical protein
MYYTIRTILVLSCLLPASTAALADEVVIIYHSGAVQQVPLLEPTEQIQQISYRKQGAVQAPAAAAPQIAPQQQPAANSKQTPTPAAPEPKAEAVKKIPIKLKWAQPRDSW